MEDQNIVMDYQEELRHEALQIIQHYMPIRIQSLRQALNGDLRDIYLELPTGSKRKFSEEWGDSNEEAPARIKRSKGLQEDHRVTMRISAAIVQPATTIMKVTTIHNKYLSPELEILADMCGIINSFLKISSVTDSDVPQRRSFADLMDDLADAEDSALAIAQSLHVYFTDRAKLVPLENKEDVQSASDSDLRKTGVEEFDKAHLIYLKISLRDLLSTYCKLYLKLSRALPEFPAARDLTRKCWIL
ncbi:hypothetical protein DFS34DRAFT_601888 [Phlyctochytrium arcticum]|nr:hypothetical protein DFS34DRAFT_601888 [Phlyctochytrium arcticum]